MSKECGWLAYQHEVRAILGRRQSQFRRVVKLQPPDKSGWAAIPMIEPWHFEFRKDATLYGPRGARPGSGWIYTALRKWDPEWPPETVNSRLLSFQPSKTGTGVGGLLWRCPYGVPGDRLWVRETWQAWASMSPEYDEWDLAQELGSDIENHTDVIEYRATSKSIGPWRPSIFMPRWASRLLLEVTDIRVERVQDITEDDAKAEGCGGIREYDENTDAVQLHYAAGGGPHKAEFIHLWDSINAKRGYSWETNPWVWVVHFKRVQVGCAG